MDNLEKITNDQEAIDEKFSFLVDNDTTAAAIILVEKACEQYMSLYKKYNVPYSYIEFFCHEFMKYGGLFTSQLKEFYDQYTTLGITYTDLIDRYIQSYYSQHNDVKTMDGEQYLSFDGQISPTLSKEMREVTSLRISELVENILNICTKIDRQDELVNVVELYERHMITKFIESYEFKDKRKKVKNPDVEPVETVADDDNHELIGEALDNQYQSSGKIVKIIIPKLNLPTIYPSNADNSRINKLKVAKKLCSPAKQIVFINKRKILAVKYSRKFIDKRTVKKEKKKFDWDF